MGIEKVRLRRCPDCGNEHLRHLKHWCAVTDRVWSPEGIEPRVYSVPAAVVNRPKSRRGRPRKDSLSMTVEGRRPWEMLGVSRSTWYRLLRKGEVSRFDDELPE